MIIPSNEDEREGFYGELIQRCLVTRSDRKAQYDTLRYYFLFGCSPDGSPATYNKVNSHIDQLTSFLFAADTTRFSIKLGASVDKKAELPRVKPMIERLNDKWGDSNADIVFSNAVTWSLVKNTMLVKAVQRGSETHPFLVDPDNFGVLREDVPMLDRQEAFVECFMTTKSQLERDLSNHPKREIILLRLSASRVEQDDMPAGVQRIIMGTIHPLSQGQTMQGNAVPPLVAEDYYRPRTSEELVECYELWVWDTEKNGYRTVTMVEPSICIYDRLAFDPKSKDGRQIFLEGEHPYTQVCPNPAPDYFWGHSEVAKLTRLQDQREHHMTQASMLVDNQVNPPKATTGMWGAIDEKVAAMQKINALLSSQDPMAKITEFKAQVPADLWQLVDRDDQMFDEASALTNISKGRGEAGVRSKGQTDVLMRAGSSRPKKRALVIEDSLERLATLYLKLDQEHNKNSLYIERPDGEQGAEFLSRQFTNDYIVKVDAHSSSPVFMEEQKNDAYALFDRGIIDGDAVLDVIQPQNTQALKARYKDIQRAQAEAKEKEAALQEGKATGKVAALKG